MKTTNILVKMLIIALTTCYLTACSISPKVQAVQIGDESLTKQELVAELKKLERVEQEVNGNRGVTATNVAAGLFWLPGLAVTMLDSYEASKLVNERKSHLTNLYNQKLAKQKTNKLAAKKAKTKQG